MLLFKKELQMDNEQMALVILFEDFTTTKVPVESLADAEYRAANHYPDVMDWYVVNARGQRMDNH